MAEHDNEFWETSFSEKKEMWGMDPVNSALLANTLFLEENLKTILVPGFGYGRNAHFFHQNGMEVTGIEISKTAIDLARKHYGEEMTVHHGSVSDMPFDDKKYDGIFCYALIHLLDQRARRKLVTDCYDQLAANGYMIFSFISKEASTFGTGRFVSTDCYEIHPGVSIYFYDNESVLEQFKDYGLVDVKMITENFPFFYVVCKKQ